MSGLRDEEAVQLRADATFEDRCFDFLGKYTILLNGTTCEKRAEQPIELNAEHKREVVDWIKSAILARVMTPQEIEDVMMKNRYMTIQEFSQAIHAAAMEKMKK